MTDVKKGLTADEVEQLTNDGMVNVSAFLSIASI